MAPITQLILLFQGDSRLYQTDKNQPGRFTKEIYFKAILYVGRYIFYHLLLTKANLYGDERDTLVYFYVKN